MPAPEVLYAVEQQPLLVEGMTDEEARCLEALGRQLAALVPGSVTQVAAEDGDPEAGDRSEQASALDVSRRPNERGWRITVRQSIGVIGVEDLRVIVLPKIPTDHFDYLSGWAVGETRIRIGEGTNVVEKGNDFLPAAWIGFLDALAVSLRADLHQEYEELSEELPFVRGGVDVRRSWMNLQRGRLIFPTTLEDLSVDNSVNRLLKAAAEVVARAAGLLVGGNRRVVGSHEPVGYALVERRAREAVYRLGQAGRLRPDDIDVEEPRMALHQVRALRLAKLIVAGIGRSLQIGDTEASSFLQPTSPIVEDGLRQLLNERLGSEIGVVRGFKQVGPFGFNPDLVVMAAGKQKATGDVKYRIRSSDWPRAILEQAIVFASVFGCEHALFIDFANDVGQSGTRSHEVAGVRYHRISWPVHGGTSPEQAADHVVNEVTKVLGLRDSDVSRSVSDAVK